MPKQAQLEQPPALKAHRQINKLSKPITFFMKYTEDWLTDKTYQIRQEINKKCQHLTWKKRAKSNKRFAFCLKRKVYARNCIGCGDYEV